MLKTVTQETETGMPKKVIIDCDPGIDDSLAIMLALSMEDVFEVDRCRKCPG